MKISVIMPTYNDADTIRESMESVLSQSFKNWELIIIDDGSTDETKDVVESFIADNDASQKVFYYYKENSDQLNAVAMGMKYVSGDYVYILHSDDLLFENSFEMFHNYTLKFDGYDAYIGDITTIDMDGNVLSLSKTLTYRKSDSRLALMSLWLGRNLYKDCAFWRVSVFKDCVYNSYLKWNIPFWFSTDFDDYLALLNVKTMPIEVFKYRIHEGNYINDKIGKLNVINGELRALTILIKYFDIPFYKLQYCIFRLCNKLNLVDFYKPLYFHREQRNNWKVVEFAIAKRFGNAYVENKFLYALVQFFKNYSDREIHISELPKDTLVYYGSDMRAFNKALLDETLSEIYLNLFSEMELGFSTIYCKKADEQTISDILKFLCIYPFVTIELE